MRDRGPPRTREMRISGKVPPDVRLPRVVARAALIAALASIVVPAVAGSRIPSAPQALDPTAFSEVDLARTQTSMTTLALDPAFRSAGSLASNENRLDALQAQVTEQKRQLEDMRQSLAAQERRLQGLQQALGEEALANARARGAPAMTMVPSLANGPTYVASAQQSAAPTRRAENRSA